MHKPVSHLRLVVQLECLPRCTPLGVALLCVLLAATTTWAGDVELQPRLRHPISVLISPNEKWLYVANQGSGSLSVIDILHQSVVREFDIAVRLSHMVWLRDNWYLATDESQHELLLFQVAADQIHVVQRLAVAPYPVSVAVAPDGRSCTVASLWSRRLSFVEIDETRGATDGDEPMKVVQVLDLPFAPRCQVYVPDRERLIVADSFRGRLAVLDSKSRELLFVREFPAHNIRGMQISSNGQMLVIAHQMLNELAHTIRNDVHWGLLMSNDLRWLKLNSLLDKNIDLYADAHMHPLGQASNATADPAGVAVAKNGMVFVSTGGVGEIAIGNEDDFNLHRVQVGKRPTDLVANGSGDVVYVANTFGDSISIVNVPEREAIGEISLGPQPPLNQVQKGELLFYDGRLSHDGWMSCHSCHTDGHTNGLINDNFSDKSFGSAKQVLSLLGRTGTEPFAWNGEQANLSGQIRSSIVHTMQGSESVADEDIAALVAFVESLPPPPPLDAVRGVQRADAVERGQNLFTQKGCVNCHAPPRFTSADVYDVGLADKQGNRKFNPPSLLGVAQRGPYFHDNRAATLEDVLTTVQHQLDQPLSTNELVDLVAFLRSL